MLLDGLEVCAHHVEFVSVADNVGTDIPDPTQHTQVTDDVMRDQAVACVDRDAALARLSSLSRSCMATHTVRSGAHVQARLPELDIKIMVDGVVIKPARIGTSYKAKTLR